MRSEGLEGIVVAQTRLSDVDGERGELIIAGRRVDNLAGKVAFEDVCAALWQQDARAVRAELGEGRAWAHARLSGAGGLSLDNGMDALRALVAQLPSEAISKARLTGAVAVFVAAWGRTRQGKSPIAPDPRSGHAADFVRLVRGEPVAPAIADALEAYLVTVANHGMNASTFAARVVASTASDAVSAVTAAIGALKGPLHGGAPGPVLDMLDAIGAPEAAASWLEAELAAGRRIMGMGHRIYRVRDPRAAVLEAAVERLEKAGVKTGRLALARAVERAATSVLAARHPDRPLKANVEFYTAILLDAVGLARSLFTPTFAVGRVAGWCAHIEEQQQHPRIIRPDSEYVGPRP